MKKHTVICPVCCRCFDPRVPHSHITQYHSNASEYELKRIRDARRKCFGTAKPIKKKCPMFS